MRVSTRRPTIIFFIVFGSCLTAAAVALNVGWILLNLREIALLILGIIFFVAIIVGLIFNTTFLVREIRRNEQHDAFINAVTHELKTPIASLRLYLETLQTRDVPDEKRREFYSVMLADTDRLLGTVEQVLRAGRAGHSGYKRRRAAMHRIDLPALVRECVELARARHPALDEGALRVVDVTQFKRGESPVVSGDADELRAAILNLIDNAIKYSPAGVRVRVEVGATDGRQAVVRVRDEGIGIPRDELKRIFKRFHRVPVPVMTRIKGTGLGLFIVRAIVERHRGRVYAESRGENQGSTFTILLPLAPAEAAEKNVAPDAAAPAPQTAEGTSA